MNFNNNHTSQVFDDIKHKYQPSQPHACNLFIADNEELNCHACNNNIFSFS